MSARVLTAAADLGSAYDLVIIGAGPAGLAAALEAAAAGVQALVLDEGAEPGGQMYRAVTRRSRGTLACLDSAYWEGAGLVRTFLASGAAYAPRAMVWSLEPAHPGPGLELGISLGGASRLVQARRVILATGAHERPMPVPGWTLPGVMLAGAAQIALKTSALVPEGRVVLAGCGPLLYLLAGELLSAGVQVGALLDTTDRGQWLESLGHLPGFLGSPYLAKGIRLMLRIRASIRWHGNVDGLEARGADRVRQVRFRAGGRWRELDADLLLLHQGVVPDINLPGAAGCELDWNPRQRCFQPRLDPAGETTVPGLAVAGDAATVGGAALAEVSGRLAALEALVALAALDPARAAERRGALARAQGRLARGRAFLDSLYRPRAAFLVPGDDKTLVCRCEEVTAGQLRAAIALGVPGANQLKAFLRCGMGPCQGRMCAATVTEMLATGGRMTPQEAGTFRLRPPVKPIPLAELAALPATPEALIAVTGEPIPLN